MICYTFGRIKKTNFKQSEEIDNMMNPKISLIILLFLCPLLLWVQKLHNDGSVMLDPSAQDTDSLAEGVTTLYYTDAKADGRIDVAPVTRVKITYEFSQAN